MLGMHTVSINFSNTAKHNRWFCLSCLRSCSPCMLFMVHPGALPQVALLLIFLTWLI